MLGNEKFSYYRLLKENQSGDCVSILLLSFFLSLSLSRYVLLFNSKTRGTTTRRPLQRPLFDVQQVKEGEEEEEAEEEFFSLFFSFLSFSFVVR